MTPTPLPPTDEITDLQRRQVASLEGIQTCMILGLIGLGFLVLALVLGLL